MKAETLAQVLLRHPGTRSLTAIASSITEPQAPSVLVQLIAAAYRAQAFSKEGQALELVAAVIENHAAGVYEQLTFEQPAGFTGDELHRLHAVSLASLLCLVVCCYLDRRYLGATQIKLITRDCEQSIAAGEL